MQLRIALAIFALLVMLQILYPLVDNCADPCIDPFVIPIPPLCPAATVPNSSNCEVQCEITVCTPTCNSGSCGP